MPLPMTVANAASLRAEGSEESAAIARLQPGDSFELLDNSLGWAWGYAGPKRLVGYVPSETLQPPAS